MCQHQYNSQTENESTDLSLRGGDYEDWIADVCELLTDAGYEEESAALFDCARDKATYRVMHNEPVDESTVKGVYVCDEHPDHGGKVVRHTCHLRICPHCAKREVARLMQRYIPKIKELAKRKGRRRLVNITLTTPISLYDDNAQDQINHYFGLIPKLFDSLMAADWRSKSGAIATVEFGENGLKLHFHIVAYVPYLKQSKLAEKWSELTCGTAQVVYIAAIDKDNPVGGAIESLKYATKFYRKDENGVPQRVSPEIILRLHEVLHGLRRVRSWGIFYKVPAVERQPLCPICDGHASRYSAIEWNIYVNTGWTPDQQRDQLSSDIGNNSLRARLLENRPPPEPPPKMMQLEF